MNIYVWRGAKVLENYSSGIVLVTAATPNDAWERLKKESPGVWASLKTGELWRIHDRFIDIEDVEKELLTIDWVAPEPEEYSIDSFPIIAVVGGE